MIVQQVSHSPLSLRVLSLSLCIPVPLNVFISLYLSLFVPVLTVHEHTVFSPSSTLRI